MQMRVLKAIAETGGREIYSGAFMQRILSFNAGSVKRAVEKLIACGLVFNHDGEYKFMNPFFAEWLKMYGRE